MTPNHAVNTRILNVLIKLKTDGRSEATIRSVNNALRIIGNHANLDEPEQVKQFVANLDRTGTYKDNLIRMYSAYTRYYEIVWNRPKYGRDTKSPKIPTKQKLEMFISAAGKALSMKLQISMETGMRPCETYDLKVKDIDLEQRLITPTPHKHGNPRTLKISLALTTTLRQFIEKVKLAQNDKLFKGNTRQYGNHYREMQKQTRKQAKRPHAEKRTPIRLPTLFCHHNVRQNKRPSVSQATDGS